MNHAHYMHIALKLAQQGAGLVSPNPLVGALIVKNDQIIGSGYHHYFGGPHAEVNAINSAGQSVEGATLYTNLEPCCHTNKRTPPCAQRIIQEKIARVVIANRDPNPFVNGSGIALLRQAGIEVIEDVCSQEGQVLNEVFFTFHRRGRPFIHLKYAQTLDGNIACLSGDSKWITHENARKKVHELRAAYDAILIGSGTLIADNPQLSIRLIDSQKKCPWRIILSSLAAIKIDHAVVNDEFREKTIVITDHADGKKNNEKAELFRSRGITLCTVDSQDGTRLNLAQVLQVLAQKNITSVLVEGGSSIITSFLQEGLVDRVSIFIAPKIIGTGINAVKDLGITKMADAFTFDDTRFEIIDDVVHMTAVPRERIRRCSPD